MTAVFNIFVIILALVIQLAVCKQSDPGTGDKLIFANILFRHGDQNIERTYPNDPWKNEQMYWPEGYGQLTDIGKHQQYELGTYLRKRYINLLPNNGSYNPGIFVQSSEVNRTIQSAAFTMIGMFPTLDSRSGSALGESVPINTIPKHMDHMLNYRQSCTLYRSLFKELMIREQAKFLQNHQLLIEYLEEHTGQKVRGFQEIYTIYDALWVEQHKNFSLPPWTKKVFYPGCDMEKLINRCSKLQTNTKQLARLRSGFLLREMLEHFSMKINSTLSPDRSLWVYSGHDATIINLLHSLGLFKPEHTPTYSTCLFIELHESSAGFHVEIYIKDRDDDIDPLEPLFIPNCGKKCPLGKIHELYEEIIPTDDFDTECHNDEATKEDTNNSRKPQ